jgi:nicotinamidase-related amidase
MKEKKVEIIFGNPALMVIDLQNDFIDEKGAIPCLNGKKAVLNTIPLIKKARKAKIPIIFTQEYHRNPKVFGPYDLGREIDGTDPIHTVIGTKGWELVDEILPLRKTDYLIHKPRYSTFIGTDLDLILRSHKIDTIIIAGVCTNICVHYNAIDAHQRDYRVRVVRECVAGTSKEAHDAALNQIQYLQFGGVQSLENVMEALDKFIERG